MHRPSLPRLRSALVLAFVAVLALSACSRREEAPTAPSAGAGASAASSPAEELRLGYFAERHPRPRPDRRGATALHQELGATKLTTQTFNAGTGEPSARCSAARSTPPTSGPAPPSTPTRQSERRGGPHRSPGRPPAVQSSWSPTASTRPDGPEGQDHRHPAAGNTQDVALQQLAQGEQPHERHGPGRRDRRRTSTTPATLDLFKSRPGRRRLGARAVEPRGWSRRRRPRARRREGPVAGRPVRRPRT